MKGLELNVTKQNGMTLVEYQLGVADVYDDRVSDKVAQLGNIIPFQYKDEDGKRSIVSYVHHDTSLEVMLRQTLKKADVLAILKGLLCAFEIGAAGVQICYLVRDLNYIYVDPESKAVKCIMVPVKQDPLGQSDIPDFFRNIVSHMRFDEADKDDYVARILTLINTDHYSNMKLKGLVDAEMEKLGLFYTRDEGLKKEADTTAAPEVQNQNVKVNRVGVMNNMRPQGMPAMGQPVPPMGRQPMGQPVPPMGGQPMMGQPVPPMNGQPMGQPRICPSRSAPSRTVTSISCRGEPAIWLSYLVKMSFAGRPVCIVTNAGYTSLTAVCFAPNPPPIRGFSTRILLFGIPSALDKIRRTWKTICVEEITCSLPYRSRHVYVRNVSIIAWLNARI